MIEDRARRSGWLSSVTVSNFGTEQFMLVFNVFTLDAFNTFLV